MKTKLTPEQSNRLIELGVDPSKASCEQYVDTGKIKNGIELPPQPKPVFKLTDILAILPKELTKELDGEIVRFQLYLYIYEGKWCVGYGENERERPKDRLFDDSPWLNLTWIWRPELIDALFELLVWCITNKHVEL